jgi:hypothetical protein
VSRNTLANANKVRDWRIYADFAEAVIQIARTLYLDEAFGVDLANTVYALDASTIDLCLSLVAWAPFRRTKAAVTLHTLLNLRGNIPTFIHISDGKLNDVNALDLLIPEAGAFYVMDRGYLDFRRVYRLTLAAAFFVTRAKSNTKLRRIKYHDAATAKTFVFLTNNFALPAPTIAELYRCRWQVELFLNWIKQHLRIKAFFGTSENAVKSEIWIAVTTYALPAAFRPWVSDVAERTQCPVDFPAVAAVVLLATVVGRQVSIRPKAHDDWTVVPNLWGAVIGRPSCAVHRARNSRVLARRISKSRSDAGQKTRAS